MYQTYLRIILFTIFLTACSASTANTPSTRVSTSPIIVDINPTLIITPAPNMSTKTSQTDSSNLDPAALPLIEKAREHMTKKFAISADKITVFSVQAVTWPDAGLGCPQQGLSYAQMETPGYLILLEAGGQTYNYHTDTGEQVILCDTKSPGEIFLPPKP